MENNIVISVTGLTKTYSVPTSNNTDGLNTVLNQITFTVNKGEKWGIIGRNGSGKSTLLKILSGIIKPTSGHVSLYGPVSHILSVGDNFIPELSGLENSIIFFRLKGMNKQQAALAATEAAKFANIGNYFYSPVKTYSDGMYLRLAFAACLQLPAIILLIDEILSVGDAGFQQKVKRHFDEKLTETETLIMVSHNPQEILAHCTHCIWLEAGGIKMMGGTKEVEEAYYHQMLKENWDRDYVRPFADNGKGIENNALIPMENDIMKIIDLEIGSANGNGNITFESGIRFRATIEKKKTNQSILPSIVIYDYLMHQILILIPQPNSSDEQQVMDLADVTGRIVFETQVNNGLLTFGNFYAELRFLQSVSEQNNFIKEVFSVHRKFPFEVKQGIIPDRIGGTFNVFIKPQNSWTISTEISNSPELG